MKTLAALLLCATSLFAQSKTPGADRWEGLLRTPNRDLNVVIDLAKNDKGEWIGDIDVTEMNAKDIPLAKIAVDGAKVSFAIPEAPDSPTFQGELSPDGKQMKGDITTGDGAFSLELKWTAEPNVQLPVKSAPVTKDFEGTWEGAITTPDGSTLRAIVKLVNGQGESTGTFTSVDQGGREFKISNIVQTGNKLKFELRLVGGVYSGELKEGAIAGIWSQNGADMPLNLKRPAAK